MKKLLLVSAFTVLAVSSVLNAEHIGSVNLKQLDQEKREFKKSILSLKGAPDLVRDIEEQQKARRALEQKTGIAQLKTKIASLRKESCILQKQDAEIAPLRQELDLILKHIKEQTRPEEQELKKLAQAARKYAPESKEAQAITKKMNGIKKEVHQKTKMLRQKRNEISKKIQAQMKKQIESAKPLSVDLKQRYDLHKKELATSNALLYKKSQELQSIMNHSQKIRSMRSAIQTMHRKFLKEDPCSSIALTDNSSWIDLVL